MVVCAGGLFFEETTASSLVKVRFGEGTPPEGLHVQPDALPHDVQFLARDRIDDHAVSC